MVGSGVFSAHARRLMRGYQDSAGISASTVKLQSQRKTRNCEKSLCFNPRGALAAAWPLPFGVLREGATNRGRGIRSW